jgi:hypothetical protein
MTFGGWALYFWKPELPTMIVEGYSGWILVPSLLDEYINQIIKGKQLFTKEGWKSVSKSVSTSLSSYGHGPFVRSKDFWSYILNKGGQLTDYDNSPRQFIERLDRIMREPMVMSIGDKYIYNFKYLHAFTKKYPDGILYRGFATQWSIDESASDPQYIKYRFDFTVYDEKPGFSNFISFATGVYGSLKRVFGKKGAK